MTSRDPNTPTQLDEEIADLLVFSVWQLREAANRAFEPMSLTTFHVVLLNFIAHDPFVRSGEMAKRIGISPVRISMLLKQLEKKGLIERSTLQRDQRGRTVALTEVGETTRVEANRLWTAVTVSRYENISQGDKATLLRLLKIIHPRPDPT